MKNLLLLFLYSTASSTFARRIIGGQSAHAGQYPFAAAINVQTNTSQFFCGGALVSNDWIVTAGHCVYNAVLFTIKLGSIYLESEDPNRLMVATSTYILHPDFNPETIENDVGLIKFRRPVDYNVYLWPLSPISSSLPDDYSVCVLGWGTTSDDDTELSDRLQYLTINTISNTECKIYYGDQITDNMVCIIGNYNEGTCTGDNGGPMIVRSGKLYVLAGIASFISANGCESTNPSGYTRVYPYREWIIDIVSSVDHNF